MSELLDLALRAHGGLDRWRKFSKVGATIVSGGGLLPMKGSELPRSPAGTATIATTREQSTVISSFGQSDWRMVFRPDQVLVKTTAGSFVQERRNPRVRIRCDHRRGMLHDAHEVFLADSVVDSGAAPLLDYLKNEIGGLVDRHRATTIT